jgi:hypothetical protein
MVVINSSRNYVLNFVVRRICKLPQKLKNDVEEMERKSAAMQMEIIANGFVTDAAREFLDKLPTVDQLIPPIRVEELAAIVEGKSLPARTLTGRLNALTNSEQAQLADKDKIDDGDDEQAE